MLILAFGGCYPPSYYDYWNEQSVARYLDSIDYGYVYTDTYPYYSLYSGYYQPRYYLSPYPYYFPFSFSLHYLYYDYPQYRHHHYSPGWRKHR
ncbi:MAG: hypothetical protein AB1442_12135 [Nitrospirota bacterium]